MMLITFFISLIPSILADGKWFMLNHGAGSPVRCAGAGKLECASDNNKDCKWGTYGSKGNYAEVTGVTASAPLVTSCPGWKPSDASDACAVLGCGAEDTWYYLAGSAGTPVRCGAPNKLECASDNNKDCKWGKYGKSTAAYGAMSDVTASAPLSVDCPGWKPDDNSDACKELQCYAPATDISILDGHLTESDGIAWVKAFSCAEGQEFNYNTPFTDLSSFVDLAQYATSIKIVSSTETVYAKECSNPVLSLNKGKDFSFTVDQNTLKCTAYSNKQNWIGSTDKMGNSCGMTSVARELEDVMFWACNNGPGLHLAIRNDNEKSNNQCRMGGKSNLDIYLGFDKDLKQDCAGNPLTITSSKRDCSVLNIDEFLLQCSDEFDIQDTRIADLATKVQNIETSLVTVNTNIGNNGGDINALTPKVEKNTDDIALLVTDIASATSQSSTTITQLQIDIDLANEKIKKFAAKTPIGIIDETDSGLKSLNINNKDLFIILLLVANLCVMSYIHCYRNQKNSSIVNKHVVVQQYDEECDARPINN